MHEPTPEEPVEPPVPAALVDLVVRGQHQGALPPHLAELTRDGHVVAWGQAWGPSPGAREAVARSLRLSPGSATERSARSLYERFLPVNRELRELCTAWQVRPNGTANDHSDPAYDLAVRRRLHAFFTAVLPLLDALGERLPRVHGHRARLEKALRGLKEGECRWFASPLCDSFHTVWMHLHQELLLSLGISRSEDQELEERLAQPSTDHRAMERLRTGHAVSAAGAAVRARSADAHGLVAALDPRRLGEATCSRLTPAVGQVPWAVGQPVVPGAAVGRLVLSAERARDMAAEGAPVVLALTGSTAADVGGSLDVAGLLILRGGTSSHAAVVARSSGVPAVCGTPELRPDPATGTLTGGGHTVCEGETVSLDGGTGQVFTGPVASQDGIVPGGHLADVLEWVDGVRCLGVRANADTAGQAATALGNGADGVGLCRTEHQLLGARLALVQDLVLAPDTRRAQAARAGLYSAQLADFRALFEAAGERPVTVRLLDAPTHELLPPRGHAPGTAREEAVEELREANPMLGVRGVRLAVLDAALYGVQTEALLTAWAETAVRRPLADPEVLVPLVSLPTEFTRTVRQVRHIAKEVSTRHGIPVPVRTGCMVETPRAALLADRLAQHADFLSFGTNDLTQLTYGFSRDDIERRALPRYLELELLQESPFTRLDPDGVGALIRVAVRRARSVRPDITLGACGDHCGDPHSLALLASWGLDYVSCSPGQVPVSRIAAAQCVLRGQGSAGHISTEARRPVEEP